MLALSLSGFALGGCGGSHRQSGTSGTEYFGGSVIFRLRPPTIGPLAKHDLPRAGTGSTNAAKRKAVIPDPRNDENLVVAQTHLAFIRFHNRVVDTLPAATPPAQKFAQARELVTKHYQWMIRTDFLPRVCKQSVVTDVFNNGRKAFEVGAVPTDVP